MPADDSGDKVLRHRGAVLDALLADPAFGSAAEPSETPTSDSDLLDSSTPSGSDSERIDSAAPSAPSGKSSSGPSASDRINALLNGGPLPGSRAEPDYADDYSSNRLHADRLDETPADRERSEEHESAAPRAQAALSPAQEKAREVVDQLKKPKVALIVGAAVALLLVVLLITTGGKEDESTDPVAATAPPPVPTSADKAEPEEEVKVIEVASAEANCPKGGTDGMDAFAGDPDKAWLCPRAFKVDGQKLSIDLGKEYAITKIGLVPGWIGTDDKGNDRWKQYRTVEEMSFTFDGGESVKVKPKSAKQTWEAKFSEPVTASEVVFILTKTSGNPTVNTVALSAVKFYGKESS